MNTIAIALASLASARRYFRSLKLRVLHPHRYQLLTATFAGGEPETIGQRGTANTPELATLECAQ